MTTADENALVEGYVKRSGGVEFGFDPASGYFALTMKGSGDEGLVRGDKADGFHLAIEPGERWDVTFALDPQQKWQFDNPAITFKNAGDEKYYRITAHGPNQVAMTADSTSSVPLPEPWTERVHPFNLNLEVKQSAGKSYKLTIDPDVKNPPPGGN